MASNLNTEGAKVRHHQGVQAPFFTPNISFEKVKYVQMRLFLANFDGSHCHFRSIFLQSPVVVSSEKKLNKKNIIITTNINNLCSDGLDTSLWPAIMTATDIPAWKVIVFFFGWPNFRASVPQQPFRFSFGWGKLKVWIGFKPFFHGFGGFCSTVCWISKVFKPHKSAKIQLETLARGESQRTSKILLSSQRCFYCW